MKYWPTIFMCAACATGAVSGDKTSTTPVTQADDVADDVALVHRITAQTREENRANREREYQQLKAERKVRYEQAAAWEEGWTPGDPMDYRGPHGLYKNAEDAIAAFTEVVETAQRQFERNNISEDKIELWRDRMDLLVTQYVEAKGRGVDFKSSAGDPEEYYTCATTPAPKALTMPVEHTDARSRNARVLACLSQGHSYNRCTDRVPTFIHVMDPTMACDKYSLDRFSRYHGMPGDLPRPAHLKYPGMILSDKKNKCR